VVDVIHKDAYESATEHIISAIEKEFETIEPELRIFLESNRFTRGGNGA